MATPIITTKEIRIFLMDKPELNPLIGGLKFDDIEIEQACINVIDHFNASIPQTGNNYSIENFPSRYILLTGVAGYLMRSASINEAVNQFDYSVEGVSVQDKNKAPLFQQIGNQMWEEYKEMAKNLKTSINVAGLFGSFHSEYNWRGGYW